MSNKSSSMKRKGGTVVTKKMMADRMDGVAALATAMEATLMEWEIWYRLLKVQKDSLTPEQFDFVVKDGPIFTEFPEKIMASVRANMPKFEPAAPIEEPKNKILGTDGLPVEKEVVNKIIT